MTSNRPTDGSLDLSGSHNPKPFISNRLKLIITKKTLHKATAKAASKKTTKNAVGRRAETRDIFVDLPLDIAFEISTHGLTPNDLLNLARVSKSSRAVFMSPGAATLWRRALKKVKDLPPCPMHLTEAQYASLVIETFCMGCDSTHGVVADHELRLRMCRRCMALNVVPMERLSLRRRFPGRIRFDLELSLLPASTAFSGGYGPSRMYFLPEAECILSELEARKQKSQEFPDEYNAFILDNQMMASKMEKEGLAIKTWVDNAENRRKEERYARLFGSRWGPCTYCGRNGHVLNGCPHRWLDRQG